MADLSNFLRSSSSGGDNRTLRPSDFIATQVSWEDVQRYGTNGALSCIGPNIADVRLVGRDGRMFYTVRSRNWNETVGLVSTSDISVVVGNEVPNGSERRVVTLREYLANAGKYGAYAGLGPDVNLNALPGDDNVGIRFQVVFFPKNTGEFVSQVFSYGTDSNDNPQNVLLLATPQGTSLSQNRSGCANVYARAVDNTSTARQFWLAAQQSQVRVGAAQTESAESRAAALARGEAVAVRIGTPSMGERFNVQMLIQVPIMQKPAVARGYGSAVTFGVMSTSKGMQKSLGSAQPTAMTDMSSSEWTAMPACGVAIHETVTLHNEILSSGNDEDDEDMGFDEFAENAGKPQLEYFEEQQSRGSARKGRQFADSSRAPALSYAARVSYGKEADEKVAPVANKNPVRNAHMRPTITVTFYYGIDGIEPTTADVEAAIADVCAQYAACKYVDKLSSATMASAGLTTPPTSTKAATTQPVPAWTMPTLQFA